MEILHTVLWLAYYGFGIIFLVYKAVHAVEERKTEKKLADSLDKLDKFLDNSKLLDK